ncbi:MAG: hypothetical protein K0S45_2970 [Nitrospira sp.]|jgi:hypothetical protein|nr:hypothetical protein [Nitrospira sp.]
MAIRYGPTQNFRRTGNRADMRSQVFSYLSWNSDEDGLTWTC